MRCVYNFSHLSYHPAKVDNRPKIAKITTATTHRQLGIHAGRAWARGIRSPIGVSIATIGPGDAEGVGGDVDGTDDEVDEGSEGVKPLEASRLG